MYTIKNLSIPSEIGFDINESVCLTKNADPNSPIIDNEYISGFTIRTPSEVLPRSADKRILSSITIIDPRGWEFNFLSAGSMLHFLSQATIHNGAIVNKCCYGKVTDNVITLVTENDSFISQISAAKNSKIKQTSVAPGSVVKVYGKESSRVTYMGRRRIATLANSRENEILSLSKSTKPIYYIQHGRYDYYDFNDQIITGIVSKPKEPMGLAEINSHMEKLSYFAVANDFKLESFEIEKYEFDGIEMPKYCMDTAGRIYVRRMGPPVYTNSIYVHKNAPYSEIGNLKIIDNAIEFSYVNHYVTLDITKVDPIKIKAFGQTDTIIIG